jgi:MFS transporter, putative metabolite:H+ symporter
VTSPTVPLTGYQKKLFVFLGVATFFEGFDHMAIAQLLPAIRADMGLSEAQTGLMVAVVNLGTVIAYVLVRQADRFGRKPILDVTIAGYTLFSFLSGLAPNVVLFALLQLVARIFLIGEWVVSTVYAAEEFPADRRGTIIGVIGAFASLGSIVCAGLVPVLSQLPWGWRSVYFVGTVPLIVLAFARRGIRETARFESLTAEERKPAPLTQIWRTPYARRVITLAGIWFFVYVCTQTSITFWKQHAIEELGFDDGDVGLTISGAAVLAMPFVFLIGRALDKLGRRGGAAIVFTLTSLGCLGAYTLTSQVPLFFAVALAVFGASAVLPVLNAFNTELFPTHLRGDAFAWSNNLLGRIGYVLAPIAVGQAAGHVGWGAAVATTAIGPLIALAMVLKFLPETSGRELEDTAKL